MLIPAIEAASAFLSMWPVATAAFVTTTHHASRLVPVAPQPLSGSSVQVAQLQRSLRRRDSLAQSFGRLSNGGTSLRTATSSGSERRSLLRIGTDCTDGSRRRGTSPLHYSSTRGDVEDDEEERRVGWEAVFTATIGQLLFLPPVLLVAHYVTKTPNYGFGSDFDLESADAWGIGILAVVPLLALQKGLEWLQPYLPDGFQKVELVAQATYLEIFGRRFQWVPVVIKSALIAISAGVGEELLFRGVLQYELAERLLLSSPIMSNTVSILVTSLIFALLHAVTTCYFFLAGISSLWFGVVFQQTSNLAVPIIAHTLYDFVACSYGGWQVSQLTDEQIDEAMNWDDKL